MTRAAVRPGAITERYMAVCLECTRSPAGRRLGAFVAPFDSKQARNEWMREHRTSHDHTVAPLDRWRSPVAAYREVFGPDA